MTGVERRDDHVDATGALAWADQLDETVRRRSWRYARFLVVFGAGVFGFTASLGFRADLWVTALIVVSWVSFAVAVGLYAFRPPVGTRGSARKHGVVMATWALLHLVVVTVGAFVFPYRPAWWLPGAAAASLPFFVAAYLETRRLPAAEGDG